MLPTPACAFSIPNAYGARTVNQLIGRALSPFPDDVVFGNKVGATRGPSGEWLTDSHPETICSQVEDVLLVLRTEASPPTYLRLWGDSPDRDGTEPLQSHRRYGAEALDACRAHGFAFGPYFPLATGGLTEVDAVTRPARRLDVSQSMIALARPLRRSPVIIPILGTTSVAYLDDNLNANAIAAELTDDEVAALTDAEDEGGASVSTMPARSSPSHTVKNATSARAYEYIAYEGPEVLPRREG